MEKRDFFFRLFFKTALLTIAAFLLFLPQRSAFAEEFESYFDVVSGVIVCDTLEQAQQQYQQKEQVAGCGFVRGRLPVFVSPIGWHLVGETETLFIKLETNSELGTQYTWARNITRRVSSI